MKDSPLYWIFPWNRFSSVASNYMYHSFVIHNATQQKILQSINTESMSDFKSFSKIITLSQGICTFQWKDRMTNYHIIYVPFRRSCRSGAGGWVSRVQLITKVLIRYISCVSSQLIFRIFMVQRNRRF